MPSDDRPEAMRELVADLVAAAERAEAQLAAVSERYQARRREAERLVAERDAARSVIRHAIQYWLPHDPTAVAFADFATWTDDDWADSNWTPAEAAEIRAATNQPHTP